jgi:sentrin-specific protease 8
MMTETPQLPPLCLFSPQVIAFYFEYLRIEGVASSIEKDILLLPGAMTYLILNSPPAEAVALLQTTPFCSSKLTLFAVNNNPNVEYAEGGSHWSLACFAASAEGATLRHYDSAGHINDREAYVLSETLQSSPAAGRNGLRVLSMQTPLQDNGFDCGIYVLAIAEELCGRWAKSGIGMDFEIQRSDIAERVGTKREHILRLLESKCSAKESVRTNV